MYVRRDVLNAKDIIAWAKEQGFETTVPPEEMHVTIAFSKTPVDWIKMGNATAYGPSANNQDGELYIPPGGPRAVEPLGPNGAVVLMFACADLAYRNEDMRAKGASWDWPGYQPHVTITYAGVPAGLDLDEIDIYQGDIELGPEIFEEIDDTAVANLIEKLGNPNHDDKGQFSSGDGGGGRNPDWSDRWSGKTLDELKWIASQSLKILDNPKSGKKAKEQAKQKGEQALKEMKSRGVIKRGARHSSSDQTLLQSIHDQAVALGAQCDSATEIENVEIVKVDKSLGLVFGWAVICKKDGHDYYDLNRDKDGNRVPEHIPEQSMLEAASDFMENSRMAKDMHNGDDNGTFIFAFPLTTDIAKAMGISSRVTGLMIAMKPKPALLEKFASGEYRGFSIGGSRVEVENFEVES